MFLRVCLCVQKFITDVYVQSIELEWLDFFVRKTNVVIGFKSDDITWQKRIGTEKSLLLFGSVTLDCCFLVYNIS